MRFDWSWDLRTVPRHVGIMIFIKLYYIIICAGRMNLHTHIDMTTIAIIIMAWLTSSTKLYYRRVQASETAV